MISAGSQATDLSLAGTNNDVLALASEVNALDSSARMKILNLLQQVKAGNATMASAISSARRVNTAQIDTMASAIILINSVISTLITESIDNYQVLDASFDGFRAFSQAATGDLYDTAAAVVAELHPNLAALRVKDAMMTNMTEQFMNTTGPRIVILSNSSTFSLDSMAEQTRKVSDFIDSTRLKISERETAATAFVDRLIAREDAKLNAKLANLTASPTSLLELKGLTNSQVMAAEVAELRRRLRLHR
jgi:hypothetical protein